MDLRPTEGDEKRLAPATCPGVGWTTLHSTVALSLSSRPERTRISCLATLDKPRVRLSLRKGACCSPAPPTSTGNPGERSGEISVLMPLLGNVFRESEPGFLLHSSHQCRICGSPQGEPHTVARSRNSRQEIKQSRPVPACRGRDLRFYGPFVEYFRQSPIE